LRPPSLAAHPGNERFALNLVSFPAPVAEKTTQISALLLVAAIGICIIAYQSTVSDLIDLWNFAGSTGYAHGGLLFLLGAYLALERWREVRPPLAPSVAGVLLVLVLSVAWLLAGLVFVQVLQQLALLALLPAVFWALFGLRGFSSLAFPLVLPIFGLPFWEVLNQNELQVLTAAAVEQLLAASGVPVSRDSVLLHIPAGVFRVAENCSGMRQLVVSVPVAAVAAYLAGFRPGGIAIFAFVGGCVALLVNTLRIYVVVLAGHLTEMQHYLVTEDHIALGWVMFAIAITALVAFITSRRAAGTQSPCSGSEVSVGLRPGLLIALLTALLVGPLLNWHLDQRVPREVGVLTLPERMGDWFLAPLQTDYEPVHGEADRTVSASYRSSQYGVVTLRLAAFTQQAQGREAVSNRNKLADQIVWHSAVPPTRVDAGAFAVDEVLVAGPGRQRLRVWSWYRTPAGSSAGLWEAKVMELWSRFTQPGETVIITLARTEADDDGASRAALAAFVDALQAPLARAF
jgi:EpsI family protein